MKKYLTFYAILGIALTTGLFAFTNPPAKKTTRPAKVHIEIDIARPKFNCERGFGLCKLVIENTARAVNTESANIELATSKSLTLTFDRDLSAERTDGSTDFVVDTDVIVGQAVSDVLGKSSVTIKAGTYKYDPYTRSVSLAAFTK